MTVLPQEDALGRLQALSLKLDGLLTDFFGDGFRDNDMITDDYADEDDHVEDYSEMDVHERTSELISEQGGVRNSQ